MSVLPVPESERVGTAFTDSLIYMRRATPQKISHNKGEECIQININQRGRVRVRDWESDSPTPDPSLKHTHTHVQTTHTHTQRRVDKALGVCGIYQILSDGLKKNLYTYGLSMEAQ